MMILPFALRRILHAKFHVLEELRVPQGLKIAPQRFFIIRVALAAEDAGLQRVAAHPPIADKVDAVYHVLLRCSGLLVRGGAVLDGFLPGDQIDGCGEEIGARLRSGIRLRVLRPRSGRSNRKQQCHRENSRHPGR